MSKLALNKVCMLQIHKHKVSFHFTFLPVRNSTGKEAKYYTQQSTNFASLILSVANLSWANIFKDFWTDYNPFSLSTTPCLSFTHKAREVTLILICFPKSCCCLTDLLCQRTGSILWNRELTTRISTHPIHPEWITASSQKLSVLDKESLSCCINPSLPMQCSLFALLPHPIHTAQVFCYSRFQPS